MDLAKYQIPDERWKFFGFESLNQFCSANLVVGRFHPSVPKDIVEAYTVCEYIMTYSYYHYPLYYEAFSKVLRTIEMAVKIRCKQKDIPLKKARSKDQVLIDRRLSDLMKELTNLENQKNLADPLARTRNIRNIIMHPESHSYTGAMTMNNMKYCVGILNKIFIPESIFAMFHAELEVVQQKTSSFQDALLILHHDNLRYLITGVEVKDAILVNNQWLYLLAAVPVMLNPEINLPNHSYIKPLTFHVTDIEVVAGILTCSEADRKKIKINANDNPENETHYKIFKKVLSSLTEDDKWIYDSNNQSEIAKEQIHFAYMYLPLVENTSTNT
jgi:hypothetical protein